jgi:predicted anti-sigma-YlaC factor YlaD
VTHLNEEVLDSYLEHVLTADEAARVERHLTECAACRADLEGLARLYSGLAALPAEPMPVDLAPRVMARITSRPERRRLWLIEALLVAQVALTLALAAWLAPLLGPHLPAAPWSPFDPSAISPVRLVAPLAARLPLGTFPAAALAPLPLALVAALLVAVWLVGNRLVLGTATRPGRRERSA